MVCWSMVWLWLALSVELRPFAAYRWFRLRRSGVRSWNWISRVFVAFSIAAGSRSAGWIAAPTHRWRRPVGLDFLDCRFGWQSHQLKMKAKYFVRSIILVVGTFSATFSLQFLVTEITRLILELPRFTDRTKSRVIDAFDDRCGRRHTLVIGKTRLHRYGFVGFLIRSLAGRATAFEQAR